MDVGLDLLGGAGGGGGGGGGVSSPNGSLSTVSKAEVVEASEVSSYSLNNELDLGLSLSLGTGGTLQKAKPCSWGEYCRILTAQDFPSIGCSRSSSSSSSSGKASNTPSVVTKTAVSGTKRAAEEGASSPNGAVSQVVGWPPIRTYRINSLVNQNKNSSVEDEKMAVENGENKDSATKKSDDRIINGNVQKKSQFRNSLFVKVNMDGIPIGRKVDLNSHTCYETLAEILEDMFFYRQTTITNVNSIRSSDENEHGAEVKKASKLLGGSSEFVLTYEDKDGDWMLVGDVPWGMFLNTVKRLRIMRTSDANGLAPRFHEGNDRQRNRPI